MTALPRESRTLAPKAEQRMLALPRENRTIGRPPDAPAS
jgi:hypothetical protein